MPAMNTSATERVTAIPAELQYLTPGTVVLRRFTAPGASVDTGTYKSYPVQIGNGRPVQDSFRVDTQGFVLGQHRSAVADFTDKAEVDAVYMPEVLEFVKQRLGADQVAARGAVLRRSASPAENASQPQAAIVHVDYGPESARETAARVYAEHFPDGPGFSRAVMTSTWRVFSPPPQDWPLALCDFRSIGDDEGVPNELYLVDQLPDDRSARSTNPRSSRLGPSSSSTPTTSGGTSPT
jgi:hypothetical protein